MTDPAAFLSSVHAHLDQLQRQDQWKYCCLVQLPLLTCAGWASSVTYGFNVFVLHIQRQFELGQDWSFATGGPVYIGSLAIFFSVLATGTISGKMVGNPNDSTGRWLRLGCAGGALLYSVGLLVSSIAMETSRMWLLYVGFSFLVAFGSCGILTSLALSTLLNFKAAGRGGLGGGLACCFLVRWPSLA